MAKGDIEVWDVLHRRAHGEKISLREGQVVADAAEALRTEYLNDVYAAMQHPETLDAGAIPCMAVMGKLLQKHGLVSAEEMENLIKGFVKLLQKHGVVSAEEMENLIKGFGMMTR